MINLRASSFVLLLVLLQCFSLFGAVRSSCVSGTEIFFINGVWVADESDVRDSAITLKLKLRTYIAGTPLDSNRCIAVSYAHNRSNGLLDLAEAIDQSWFDVIPPDLDEHLAKYRRSAQERLNKLIFIGHSQGNLYASQAYARLTTESPVMTRNDVRVIGVATPERSIAGEQGLDTTLPYTTLTEDFVADVVFQYVNPFRLRPNTHNNQFPGCLSASLCHEFIDSYLNGNMSGPRILNHLVSAITALDQPPPPPPPPGTTWTQKTPANSPSARTGHAMAYDAARGQVVLFGGTSADSYFNNFNDTWVWDGNNWMQKSPASSPAARNYHAMAYDAARGQVVLFGGRDMSTSYPDTWVWDGNDWTQKWPASSPTPRVRPAMVYDAARGEVVVFGGALMGPFGWYGDTWVWVWNGTNWAQKNPASSPTLRVYHAMAYDAARAQTVLFGGSGMSVPYILDDTWVWP